MMAPLRTPFVSVATFAWLAGCVTAPSAPAAPMDVRVSGFGMDQGLAARQQADVRCAAEGRTLRPSIYDRFEAGTWVFVEGCA